MAGKQLCEFHKQAAVTIGGKERVVREKLQTSEQNVQSKPVQAARAKQWSALEEAVADSGAIGTDELGRTALHYAAGYGALSSVALLLRHGASANAADALGMTPLHWACLKNQAAVVRVLLCEGGADVHARAVAGIFRGRSPLELAARTGDGQMKQVLSESLGVSLFAVGRVVGRGGSSTVSRAVHRLSNDVVAIKTTRATTHNADGARGARANDGQRTPLQAAQAERRALSSLRHPFIIALHEAFQTADAFYLAIEFCAGGDLRRLLGRQKDKILPQASAIFVAAEVVLALEHMHSRMLLHRDVKAENVLIDAHGHVRLADLNIAAQLASSDLRAYSVVGTPVATAPEVLCGRGATFASDFWSLGVLVFEMVSGRAPFPADASLTPAPAIVVREILRGDRAELPASTSAVVVEAVDSLLQRDEALRPRDACAVKTLGLFEFVEWDALLQLRTPSPLRGQVHDTRCVELADWEYTRPTLRLKGLASESHLRQHMEATST
uniref:Protein kinase domain-containing protein n=1 Tax=Chrysotila carterae TaxID=13221 RepID=A0A7S4BZT5_CHRCT|mmetsp:Transcript_7168/g.15841  ORF Transcript_7168/g.15841 Transcript_7168/m.15841 type:complete len:499 (+) Transcript_7168:100-1596(+)